MVDRRRSPSVIDLSGLPPRLLEGGRFAHFTTSKVPIPTGSVELDALLAGGWPRHEISYIQGDSGSGKSSLCEEAALNFLRAGGDLAVIFCLDGDHPLNGFEARVSQTNRILISSQTDITLSFAMLESLMGENSGLDVMAVFDDLSSLTPNYRSAVSKVLKGLTGMRKFLKANLTILLVNQLRDTDRGSVGATAYNRIFNQASVAVHLGPQEFLHDGTSIEGFTSSCLMLLPLDHQGTQFNITVKYGTGIVG